MATIDELRFVLVELETLLPKTAQVIVKLLAGGYKSKNCKIPKKLTDQGIFTKSPFCCAMSHVLTTEYKQEAMLTYLVNNGYIISLTRKDTLNYGYRLREKQVAYRVSSKLLPLAEVICND